MNKKLSNRLTKDWTKTTELAYGYTGKVGRTGEQWLAEILKERGYDVFDHEESHQQQVQGIDLTINGLNLSRPYTIDVKSNIKDDGTFFIEVSEKGWLRNPQKISDCIWHVNPNTKQTARYSRKKMKTFIVNNLTNTNFIKNLKTGMLFALNVNNIPVELNFIKVEM